MTTTLLLGAIIAGLVYLLFQYSTLSKKLSATTSMSADDMVCVGNKDSKQLKIVIYL